MQLGPLSCLTKLGAKCSELEQKFISRSCIESFRNEHTRSSPLDPKLMFFCISYHLHAFGTIKLPYETRGKMFRTSAKVHATKLHRIISQRTHPIHPIGPQTHVLVRSVPFWCIWNHLVALRNSLQNGPNKCKSLCHEVASEFFATKAPGPPPFNPKLIFWCISYHLGVFGAVW